MGDLSVLPRSSALVLARTYGIYYSERISLSTAARTCTLFRTALALFLLQKRQLRLVTLVFLFQPPSIREIILRYNVFRQFFCRNRNITLGQPPKSALWRQTPGLPRPARRNLLLRGPEGVDGLYCCERTGSIMRSRTRSKQSGCARLSSRAVPL